MSYPSQLRVFSAISLLEPQFSAHRQPLYGGSTEPQSDKHTHSLATVRLKDMASTIVAPLLAMHMYVASSMILMSLMVRRPSEMVILPDDSWEGEPGGNAGKLGSLTLWGEGEEGREGRGEGGGE